MKEFKLHSMNIKENWFHFRVNLGSMIESFSITYCHDGTVCMTGDYGCLCWRRNYDFLPEGADYGFPAEGVYINYFAEKVVRAEESQRIKTWKKELATSQILESIEEYRCEGNDMAVEELESICEKIDYLEDGDYGYIQMLEMFDTDVYCMESEYFCEIGRTYTNMFRIQFDMIQSVSHLILEAIREDKLNDNQECG